MDVEFYRRMSVVLNRIPYGKVATYGQIALLCGRPQNARQVGFGLKRGLAGENVAAHRVVSAKGRLSGAVYFDTLEQQQLMLEAEGVEIQWEPQGWYVDLTRFGWKHTLEDVLAFPWNSQQI